MNLFLFMKRLGLTLIMVMVLPVYLVVKLFDDTLGYDKLDKKPGENAGDDKTK